jgi:hypothetical protein
MREAMSEKHPQECFNCIGQTHLEAYYSSTQRSMSHAVTTVIDQRVVFANRVPHTTATGSAKQSCKKQGKIIKYREK